MDPVWSGEDDVAMSVDSGEEEWHRLHDIRLNGQMLGEWGKDSQDCSNNIFRLS